ncbi:single-stranded DNA-binding protein [Bacillus sp. 1P06AnD]|uniref:single-stranded DNA-binding protein n=1 Tax=Bacillus sp. 1P06AnD TaxID=3132208 RepID=UPI00399FF75A
MINQVTLVGRLTKDPDLRYTAEGHAVSNITIAVNRHYRNEHGGYDADFVQCTIWKKSAENTAQYCRKGGLIGVTGRIQTRHYQDSADKRVFVTEVVADQVTFIGNKRQSGERQDSEAILR